MSESTTGLMLRTPDGAVWRFDPGALWLELLTTGGPGAFARYESLHRPEDLVRWLGECRLGLAGVTVGADDLVAARSLRDALWRLARARVYGEPAGAADCDVLNRAAAAPPLVRAIARDGLSARTLPGGVGQVLSTVARDAIEVLTGPSGERLRECDGANCHLLFVDTSRPGRRRWCSMERCGNRHKVQALRARRESRMQGVRE